MFSSQCCGILHDRISQITVDNRSSSYDISLLDPLFNWCTLHNSQAIRISHCKKKLARLLFDFGVISTTDNDCEQPVPSIAFCLQQLSPVARQQSCSVCNSCGLTPGWTQGRINICTYFVYEIQISLQGSVWGMIGMQQKQNHQSQLPNMVTC